LEPAENYPILSYFFSFDEERSEEDSSGGGPLRTFIIDCAGWKTMFGDGAEGGECGL
jgi:hypothetical protein